MNTSLDEPGRRLVVAPGVVPELVLRHRVRRVRQLAELRLELAQDGVLDLVVDDEAGVRRADLGGNSTDLKNCPKNCPKRILEKDVYELLLLPAC